MWKEPISSLYPGAQFMPRADSGIVDDVERRLGHPIPSDLQQLLLESDGVLGEFSVDVIWGSRRIIESNLEFRNRDDFAHLYAPFDELLFFGDNGSGDQFAFSVDPSKTGVFAWEHETDTRRRVADDLSDYLTQRLSTDGDDRYVD